MPFTLEEVEQAMRSAAEQVAGRKLTDEEFAKLVRAAAKEKARV